MPRWIVTRTYYVDAPHEFAAVRAAGGPTLKTVRVRELDKSVIEMEKALDQHQVNFMMEDPMRREPLPDSKPRTRRRASAKRKGQAA